MFVLIEQEVLNNELFIFQMNIMSSRQVKNREGLKKGILWNMDETIAVFRAQLYFSLYLCVEINLLDIVYHSVLFSGNEPEQMKLLTSAHIVLKHKKELLFF